jgi:hypothetical protein
MRAQYKVFLLFFLISIIYCSARFYIGIRSNWLSPLIFSDIDEPVYISHSQTIASLKLSELFNVLRGNDTGFKISSFPYILTDYVIGNIFNVNYVNPFLIASIFDLFCPLISLIVLYFTFKVIVSDSDQAIVSSLVVVFLPWFISPIGKIIDPLSGYFPHVALYLSAYFGSIPTHRWLYTQLSTTLFFVQFALIVQTLIQNKRQIYSLLILAVISALQMYIYFFGWATSAIILFELVVYLYLSSGNYRSFARYVYVILVFLLLSIPGVIVISKYVDSSKYNLFTSQSVSIPVFSNYSNYIYLPVVHLILIAALLLFKRKLNTIEQKFNLLVTLFVFFILAEVFLVNLQPLLNKPLQPFHFTALYVHPILSGLLVLLILTMSNQLVKVQRFIMLAALGAVIGNSLKISNEELSSYHRSDRVLELLKFMRDDLAPYSTLAVYPYLYSNKPETRKHIDYTSYWIGAITSKQILSDFILLSKSSEEILNSELYYSWLYKGNVDVLTACPNKFETMSAQNYYNGMLYLYENKYRECYLLNSAKQNFSLCSAMKNLPVDYILRNYDKELPNPEWYNLYTETIFADPNINVKLLRFKRSDYLQDNCLSEKSS